MSQKSQLENDLEGWYSEVLLKIKSTSPKDGPSSPDAKTPSIMNYVGPSFLIAIACLDPGNLSGDIAVGQKTDYRLLWLLILSGFFCYFYQSLALTLGTYSQSGISKLCRRYYPWKWSICLWVMAEIALMASDTQEVLGTAIALNVLFGIEIFWGVFLSLLLAFLMLFVQNLGQRTFEKLFAFFISIMSICFFVNFWIVPKRWGEMAWGFVPQLQRNDVGYGISLLGAILMPQNLFLHSNLVNTRKINKDNV